MSYILRLKDKKWPPIGLRIIKSAVAVLVVYFIYYLRGFKGIPFYSAIGAIQCIQPYRTSSKKVMLDRVFGSLNGAFYGLITILADMYFIQETNQFEYFILVSIMIIPLMYTSVACKKAGVTYFSCVVFLSIVIIHIDDANPILFVVDRLIDTAIGIGVATVVNNLSLPKRRDRDTLFVTGLDETLLTQDKKLTQYSLVELNRMIENGMRFTIATERTLASLIETNRGIQLKLPVVLFDGAVLYDLEENECIAVTPIDIDVVRLLQELIHEENYCSFTSSFVQETLMIYYDELHNEMEEMLYKKLRVSPYRNYHKGEMLTGTVPFYIMVFAEMEKLSELYHKIKRSEMSKEIRMVRLMSRDYEGFGYLKIYNKECSKPKMLQILKDKLEIEHSITIGTIPSQNDIILHEENENETVKCLKKRFEIQKWRK